MSQELHYTSIPRGLKPGSRGFCTVGMTPHMPGPLVERLEALSGYQPVFPPHDPSAALNPIVFSHLRLTVGGKMVSVLSRIGPAGLDYSGRPNKYAHHIVLDRDERPEGGPAWLLSQPGFIQSTWEGDPREIPAGRTPPQGDRQPGLARAWQTLTGDGGWAGVLAESFLADPRRTVFLEFRPGMDLLPLFVEALALVPESRRWDVDFSTYFNQLPQGVGCAWRGVLEGSDDAKNALRLPNALVLDLCRAFGRAEGGVLVHMAQTGERIVQQPVATAAKPESGRHIPRMPHEPTVLSPDPSGQPGAPPTRSTSASYELAPELARLVPGAAFSGVSGHPNSAGRAHNRPLALIAVLFAACLIPFVAAGFLLLRSPGPAITVEPDTETEQRKPEPKATVTNEPKAITRERAAEHEHRTMQDINTPNPKQSQDVLLSPDAIVAGPPSPASDGNSGVHMDQSIRKANPTTIPNPLFFSLNEPVSALVPRNQESLMVGDSNFQLAKMELLGGDEDLKYETPVEASELNVFPINKDISRMPSNSRALATLRAKSKNQIEFVWDTNQLPGDQHGEVRRSLRDCVLKITSATGEIRYCILRSQPPSPENVKQFNVRLKKLHEGSFIQHRYNWDNKDSFKGTHRKIEIAHCKLSAQDGRDAIPLHKDNDGSWVSSLDGESLLSVKLDKNEILMLLADKEPRSLPNRISETEKRVERLSKQRLKYENDDRSKDEEGRKEKLADFKKGIEELTATVRRQRRLLELHTAFVDLSITYDVAGLKLEIARLNTRTLAQSRP